MGPALAAERPNIVFILIDDQRYDAASALGHPFLETPHLDRLIARGVLFENAFVTTSLCSPSRASILTGQYAHRHGVLDNRTRLNPDTPTFPQELRRSCSTCRTRRCMRRSGQRNAISAAMPGNGTRRP